MSAEFNTIKGEVDNELQKIDSINDKIKLNEINEDCIKKISHFISLSKEMDSRSSSIHNFSLNYLILLVMLATLVFSVIDNVWKWVPLMIIALQIIMPLIAICRYYWQQKADYIFKRENLNEYSNKCKWFYYGNPHISKIKLNPKKDKDVDESVLEYMKGLKVLVGNYIGNDIKADVKDNLIQLYLLQVHNYYKNKYYEKLSEVYRWNIGLLVIGLVLGGALAFF